MFAEDEDETEEDEENEEEPVRCRLLSSDFYDCAPNKYANVFHPMAFVLNSDNIRPIKGPTFLSARRDRRRLGPFLVDAVDRIPAEFVSMQGEMRAGRAYRGPYNANQKVIVWPALFLFSLLVCLPHASCH
ncbi:hypothetical protein GWI33_006270 [Rhynchophorus ferrugineus]|uniref:Uncharacterized protein n=1 Tax=Rhynchophorus ferrugineus TaxID=354439 RepID=A0A834IM62_RHYFE|nr:hypothetical protein GWI33_006270 [Rhynchophorus ferrugineus]